MRDRTHNKCPSCGYQHQVGTKRRSCYDCGGSMQHPDPRSARIAELKAEVERLKRDKITLQNNFEKVFEHAAIARNNALEEAAQAMKPMLRNMISRGQAAAAIRALKVEVK